MSVVHKRALQSAISFQPYMTKCIDVFFFLNERTGQEESCHQSSLKPHPCSGGLSSKIYHSIWTLFTYSLLKPMKKKYNFNTQKKFAEKSVQSCTCNCKLKRSVSCFRVAVCVWMCALRTFMIALFYVLPDSAC